MTLNEQTPSETYITQEILSLRMEIISKERLKADNAICHVKTINRGPGSLDQSEQ
jgi:hypothetical protein